jgi:hypothetical protein
VKVVNGRSHSKQWAGCDVNLSESRSNQETCHKTSASDELAKAWDEKTDVIRLFIEIRPSMSNCVMKLNTS